MRIDFVASFVYLTVRIDFVASFVYSPVESPMERFVCVLPCAAYMNVAHLLSGLSSQFYLYSLHFSFQQSTVRKTRAPATDL